MSSGCSKGLSARPQPTEAPEASPPGYVEDAFKARTLLADFFSILLRGSEKIEMIRRPGTVTDCEAVAKGFGEISLGRLYGIVHGFASCEMGGDG